MSDKRLKYGAEEILSILIELGVSTGHADSANSLREEISFQLHELRDKASELQRAINKIARIQCDRETDFDEARERCISAISIAKRHGELK